MRRVSLADVARAAGVGKATASRALSGNDEVGAATRSRILDIAESMGYQPHRPAQALRTGRFRSVALFVPLEQDWTGRVMLECARAAAARGDQLVVHDVTVLGGTAAAVAAVLNAAADRVCVVGAPADVADALAADPGTTALLALLVRAGDPVPAGDAVARALAGST